ncbi:hypothetical protein [Mediterraneibacter gnavus]|uniref:hypothetical protein n=1 Tax=Mediterraneibacter gnavus TaxID=33038 RepID=UPI0032B7E6F6
MKWISNPRMRRVQSTTRDICLIHACCSEGFICWLERIRMIVDTAQDKEEVGI